uniref:Uncharacterized protein n=1 Tax=Romanomermis culicivorax TaxID=13658 RepID=A0A915KCV3_ROMCU
DGFYDLEQEKAEVPIPELATTTLATIKISTTTTKAPAGTVQTSTTARGVATTTRPAPQATTVATALEICDESKFQHLVNQVHCHYQGRFHNPVDNFQHCNQGPDELCNEFSFKPHQHRGQCSHQVQ